MSNGQHVSALHRSLLKRKLGRRDLHDAQSEYNLMDRQREEPSASAESSGAPMEPPAEHLASANAGSSNQQLDGTEGVEPEGSGEQAEPGDGVVHRTPLTAGVRAAAHEGQHLASPEAEQQWPEVAVAENLQRRLAAMFLAGPGAPRPSKMEPIADAARLWLLVAVKREAASFWGAHEEQAVRSSSEAAAAAAVEAAKAVEGPPMAAWEAVARRSQSGSRLSRLEASQGRAARTHGGRSIISAQ